jgi:hypothetical protein
MNLESMSKVKIKGKSTYTIYMIDVLNSIYIGKTSDFGRRRSQHISACHNKNSKDYNMPVYKYIREVEEKGELKFNQTSFQIIEEITDYEDEDDILYCEKAWIEFYEWFGFKMLNVSRPIINEEERNEHIKKYYEENKQKVLERCKKYREKNKEELNRKRGKKAKEKRANETPEEKLERLKKRREKYAKKKLEERTNRNNS